MTSVATTAPVQGAESERPLATPGRRTLGELYDQFGSIAYSLALSITRDRGSAERIVTAAFAATWRQSERDLGSVGGFFIALMTSVRTDAFASRPAARSVRSAFAHRARRQAAISLELAVSQALDDLPEEQRRVLALAYFGGLGVGDIASELNQPMSHVKANLQAALRHVRTVVAGYSGEMVPL